MTITTEEIKELRDQTGVSVMQCRRALEESGGDKVKAILVLNKRSADIAAKKGDRILGAGAVQSYIHGTGSIGAMVVLASETDFVAKNEEFKSIAYDIAMHVAALNPEFLSSDDMDEGFKVRLMEMFQKDVADLDKPADVKQKILDGKIEAYIKERALLDQPFVKNGETTIRQIINNAIQKFGEKIEVVKFIRFAA